MLRGSLRWLNREVFGWVDLRVNDAVQEPNWIDNQREDYKSANLEEWR